MKRIIGIILTTVILSTPVFGYELPAWSKADIAMQVAVHLITHLDYAQTMQIHKHYPRVHEFNDWIGRSAKPHNVQKYFIFSHLFKLTGAMLLPNPYRRVFQMLWIGIGVKNITHNRSMGLRVRF